MPMYIQHRCIIIYHIAGKFGRELNLAVLVVYLCMHATTKLKIRQYFIHYYTCIYIRVVIQY